MRVIPELSSQYFLLRVHSVTTPGLTFELGNSLNPFPFQADREHLGNFEKNDSCLFMGT